MLIYWTISNNIRGKQLIGLSQSRVNVRHMSRHPRNLTLLWRIGDGAAWLTGPAVTNHDEHTQLGLTSLSPLLYNPFACAFEFTNFKIERCFVPAKLNSLKCVQMSHSHLKQSELSITICRIRCGYTEVYHRKKTFLPNIPFFRSLRTSMQYLRFQLHTLFNPLQSLVPK